MNALIILSGGQGKQLMSTQIVREIVESDKYKQVIASCAYVWWLQELELELKKKGYRNFRFIPMQNLGSILQTVIAKSDEWQILKDNVYDESDFMLRKANFYEVLRKKWGLKTKSDFDSNGSNLLPKVVDDDQPMPADFSKEIKEITSKYKKIILTCFRGGMSNLPGPDGKRRMPQPEQGLLRQYPVEDAEELVQKLSDKGYSVIQVKLPEEPLIKGCIDLGKEYSMLFWAKLAESVDGVITIDSCLMHACIKSAKKMVVIWRETTPMQFGYSKAINLLPTNYTPAAPLMGGFPDSPICDAASADEVIDAYEKA